MPLASSIKSLILEFLFPKTVRILELEALSLSDLLERLPRAEDVRDKLVIAIFDYKNSTVKELVWELKYKGNKTIAETLGGILCDTAYAELEELALFESAEWSSRKIILIPIPISAKRRAERGWNQSELLTAGIMAKDERRIFEYLPHQLIKVRHTESQTKTRSKKERLLNLEESMEITNPVLVKDKTVVLIDDVTTTGATFKEARRALQNAGVKKILCLAIAH